MPLAVFLNILGGFNLHLEDREAPVLPRKTRALLAYLATQQGRPVMREAVAELLWSDRGSEQVRHSLRQALGDLRKHFRDRDVVLTVDRGLVLADDIQCDVSGLLRLTPDSDRAARQRAADAYAGPLLDGFPPVSKDFD